MLDLKFVFSDSWNSGAAKDLKQYDRDALLKLRESSAAMARPTNLPEIPDIILKTPLLANNGMGLLGSGGGGMGMGDKGIVSDWRNGNNPFSPGYVKSARQVSIIFFKFFFF